MKVAFIVNQFPLLSETFILNQITGLIDKGCEVDIFAHKVGGELTAQPDFQNYNLRRRTYCLTPAEQSSRGLNLVNALRSFSSGLLRNPGVMLRSTRALRFGRVAGFRTYLHQTRLFLDNGPYDIVHCQFGPNGNLGLQFKEAGVLRGKLIVQFRGYDAAAYVRVMGREVYRNLFRNADLILCVSESLRTRLHEFGCEKEKILVHHSGVNTKKFSFLLKRMRIDDSVRILTIGRLVEKKGVRYGIYAVAEALKTHPNIEYRVVGDGPLREELLGLVESLHAGTRIQLLGWKRQDEIVRLFEDSDILLAPSVTGENGDEEGIPNVLMEALARGLPVVATHHAGIPELVQEGKSGFLVPERDSRALGEKLKLLIDNKHQWPAMGEAGRRFVEQHFDIEKLNDRLLEIYQTLHTSSGRVAL